MRFDGDGWAAIKTDRFNHIGVERALGQKFDAWDGFGFCLKNLNEQLADGLALYLRVVLAL